MMKIAKDLMEPYLRNVLERYAKTCVDRLSAATPVDTGETASSWGYEVEIKGDVATIYFTNSHVEKGVNVALLLQYGHATRNGGYFQGIDYINPPAKDIFTQIVENAWREVTKL